MQTNASITEYRDAAGALEAVAATCPLFSGVKFSAVVEMLSTARPDLAAFLADASWGSTGLGAVLFERVAW